MREIKFRYRFRNRKTNEIITVILDISQIEIQGLEPNPFKGFDWEILSRDQYTGLKDNNGKEIYEGDIIKYAGLHWRVDYDAPAFALCRKNILEDLYQTQPIWIIGNIYENKE